MKIQQYAGVYECMKNEWMNQWMNEWTLLNKFICSRIKTWMLENLKQHETNQSRASQWQKQNRKMPFYDLELKFNVRFSRLASVWKY